MEWVETTGKTVEEAKDRALAQLGVHPEDAEFEVLEEPKAGLFGRVRGEARVRARVRPTQVRQKIERRDRKRTGQGDKKPREPKAAKEPAAAKQGAAADRASAPKQPRAPKPQKAAVRSGSDTTVNKEEEQVVDAQQVGEEATRFMSGLLEAFGLQGQVSLVQDGEDLEVQVAGDELGLLVGPRGSTLQAVQDLARVASQRRLGDHDTRLRVDVGGYRERRRAALGAFAMKMADEVKSSGVSRVLEPMSSADRKIIHDTLSEVEGIATRSEGDDPYRRVVIAPAND
jgi:spoIIIJ-associated protein